MSKESESNQDHQLPPLTNAEIEQYLSSGLFGGIGKKTASKLVAQFGAATLSVLENSPEQLYQIPGLARYRISEITEAWSRSKENPAYPAVALLLGHGTSLGLTLKICEHYQQDTMKVLASNPYSLIDEVDGVGFKTADAIALSLGIEPDSDFRYIQGLRQALKDAQRQGHCFLPEAELINRAVKMLQLPDHIPKTSAVQEAIGKGTQNQTFAAGLLSGSIYLRIVYRIELRVALQVIEFLGQPTEPTKDLEEWLLRYESAAERSLSRLNEEQRQALFMAERHSFSILTGGPGRGKTYILKILVQWLKSNRLTVALAAPTGKAASRMKNATGTKAYTIHRLLQWQGSGQAFLYNDKNPLDIDWLIVDEFSMVDIFLFNSLLKALPPGAKVLLVGDSDQLPSVGPGMVLRDLRISEMVPTTRLQTIYRQRDESPIIYAAEDVNRGKIPKLEKFKQAKQWMDVGDCAMWETPTPEATAEAIVELAVAMKATDVDLSQFLMVLAPQKKGVCGVSNLNILLQQIFNPRLPDSAEVEWNEVVYRVKDRVIQLKNRYDIVPAVMNGETGIVESVDAENQQVTVKFEEGAIVNYRSSELEQIMHSFCLTCHKSQGSEFPYVIMPLLLSNRHMLTRQLLYTTMTRASSTFIAVGQTRALEIAVATDKPARRYTQLQTQLISTVSELTQTFNSLQKKPTAKSATTATISVAKRLKERGMQVTTGQRTKIGSLTLQLYQDKYKHLPSKQPEQMEDMKFKTKTYHYSSDAVHLIDLAIDIVLNN